MQLRNTLRMFATARQLKSTDINAALISFNQNLTHFINKKSVIHTDHKLRELSKLFKNAVNTTKDLQDKILYENCRKACLKLVGVKKDEDFASTVADYAVRGLMAAAIIPVVAVLDNPVSTVAGDVAFGLITDDTQPPSKPIKRKQLILLTVLERSVQEKIDYFTSLQCAERHGKVSNKM